MKTIAMSFRCLLALLLSGFSATLVGQTINGPESVEFHPRSGRLFISNKGSGDIQVRDALGQLSLFTALPSSPHGLEVVGGTLFVADGAKVRGYALDTATQVLDYTISGASFLNGMSSDGIDTLYVSDFTNKRLYAVEVGNLALVSHTTLVPATVITPNGVTYDRPNNRLLVVGWGSSAKVYQYDFGSTLFTQLIATTLGNLDGITRDCNGNAYISAWSSNSIYRIAAPVTTGSTPVLLSAAGAQPSDIAFNRTSGEIVSPNYGAHTVTAYASGCEAPIFADRFDDSNH